MVSFITIKALPPSVSVKSILDAELKEEGIVTPVANAMPSSRTPVLFLL
jgi:hypothetical protein